MGSWPLRKWARGAKTRQVTGPQYTPMASCWFWRGRCGAAPELEDTFWRGRCGTAPGSAEGLFGGTGVALPRGPRKVARALHGRGGSYGQVTIIMQHCFLSPVAHCTSASGGDPASVTVLFLFCSACHLCMRPVPRFLDDCVVMRRALPRHFVHAVFLSASLSDPVTCSSEAWGIQAGCLKCISLSCHCHSCDSEHDPI